MNPPAIDSAPLSAGATQLLRDFVLRFLNKHTQGYTTSQLVEEVMHGVRVLKGLDELVVADNLACLLDILQKDHVVDLRYNRLQAEYQWYILTEPSPSYTVTQI